MLANCGASIGRVGIAQDDPRIYKTTFQKSISVIKANKALIDNRFLYYFLVFKSALLVGLGNGAAQPNLLIGDLKRIDVPVPPQQVQRKIVNILLAYDELMENSQRRIRILEAMARALYYEWFVHEKLPMQKPRINLQCRAFGNLCELVKESFDEQLHTDRPLLDLSRMPQHSIAPSDTGQSSQLTTSRILFEPGDTLFGAIRCYLHKVVAAHYAGVTNTSVLVLRPRKPSFRSLVAIIASDTETIRWADTHSAGTKMPVINWGVFQTMRVPLPSDTLAERFERIAGPMLDQIGVLATQIQNLRQTRDLLLPRLLSGKVNVEGANG